MKINSIAFSGNLDKMREAVWATFFHKQSTDENPNHGLCPTGEDSWCKFQKTNGAYKHINSLPEAIMTLIKPIYRDLSHPTLLKKCLHGKTQNCNESFNNIVWTRCPKRVFVGRIALELCLYDAATCFNDGNVGRYKVLQKLKIDPGSHTLEGLKAMDARRILRQKCKVNFMVRAKRRGLKRNAEELIENGEEDYMAGGF
jgi:hypothetical protein